MQGTPTALREKLATLPVVKSGLSLMTGTMLTSALGLVFWVLAARLYDAADFGVSTTTVYTMMMLADLACLGLRTGLVRYMPQTGSMTRRTIAWGYGIVTIASSVTATLFLLGLQLWAPALAELRNSVLLAIFFVTSTAFWALFMLEDAVLVGMRKSTWVPIENTLFGVLKIALLIPFASISPTLGIFWAWTLPVFPIVIVINLLVSRLIKKVPLDTAVEEVRALGSLLRGLMTFSLADWLASLARLVALAVIPLMVLAQTNKAQAGYFQASWLIAFTIMALSSNAAYALLAESSYDRARLHRNSMHAGLLSLAMTVPAMLIGLVGARYLLLAYGSDYADNSVTVLRILLLAALPNVMHQIFIGRLRAQNRMGGVVFFEILLSAIVVVLAWLFLPRYGIAGVGIAWLVGLTVLGSYAFISESLWWWASRLDTRIVRRIGSGYRKARSGRPARGLDARLGLALSTIGVTDSTVRWQFSGDHDQTAIVTTTGNDNLEVSFARSRLGADRLATRQSVVEKLAANPTLREIHPLLPRVESSSCTPNEEFVVSGFHDGPMAADIVRSNVPIERVCRAVLASVEPLHAKTARMALVDEPMLNSWIDKPLANLANLGRASSGNMQLVRRALADTFVGATVQVGQIQGELTLDNAKMATEPLAVTGFQRWEWSREMPLVVDPASLALSSLVLRGHVELGEVVRSLLLDPVRFEEHTAMLIGDRESLPSAGVILLAWLHMVGRPIPPRRTISSDVFWLARNARPVLAGLHVMAGARH